MSEENNHQEEQNTNERAENIAENLKNEAKHVADDFKEGWNEVTKYPDALLLFRVGDFYETFGGDAVKAAGILGIVIGSLGVHKFVLGYNKEGIIQIILSIVTCGVGGIIGLIEGIIYLTKSDEEFYETYQVNKRPWF